MYRTYKPRCYTVPQRTSLGVLSCCSHSKKNWTDEKSDGPLTKFYSRLPISCRCWISRTPDLLSRLRHLQGKTNCFLLENCLLPQSVKSKPNDTSDQQKHIQVFESNEVHAFHHHICGDTTCNSNKTVGV